MLLWFGEATGGHGAPGVGVIPELLVEEELPLLLAELLLDPGVEFEELEFEDPGFDVEPGVVLFAVPGKVPHGLELEEPFGVLAVGEVDGCVGVVPGVVVVGLALGEVVEPGVDCGVPAGGVAVLAGGVAVLAGGVAVLAGGVAGEPGVDCPGVACAGVPELPAGAVPPDGAACAIAQLAQLNTTNKHAIFIFDIRFKTSQKFGRNSFFPAADARFQINTMRNITSLGIRRMP